MSLFIIPGSCSKLDLLQIKLKHKEMVYIFKKSFITKTLEISYIIHVFTIAEEQ